MGSGNYQLSLTQRCGELLNWGVKISKQGLDKRLNQNACVFIKSVLKQVLRLKLMEGSTGDLLKGFKGVKILDSTSFQLPEGLSEHYRGSGGGASTSGIKTHYQVAIANGDDMALEVTQGATSDSSTRLHYGAPGDLVLFDLGYFTLKLLQRITTQKLWYLSRIKYSTVVWLKTCDGLQRLNWKEQIKKMQEGQLEEIEVYLGEDQKIKTRLIIERVPDRIANEKRRKLKTDKVNKRKVISKGRLEFCALNAFISNTTKQQLAKEHVRAIYSLRWQVEIYFKTWKSYMNIDKIEKMNIHRFNCTHYASLIYIVLSTKLFLFFKHSTWKKYRKELSELKALKLLARHRDWIWEVLYQPTKKARDRLKTIEDILNTHCIKERKNGTLTPFQIMKTALS